MLHLLISIVGIIITILFVVGTHEAGHFLVARLVGVKVLTFSIGFGKRIYSWYDKSGTEYVIAWIPLGGYVRMLDESEEVVAKEDLPRAYNNQPFYKKFLIVAAGPLTNFFCAFLLYWLIFTLGFVTMKPIIGEVTPDSIAAKAGLAPMQEITSIDQKPVQTWMNIVFKLLLHTGNDDQLTMGVRNVKNNSEKTATLDLTTWRMDNLNPDPFKSLGFMPYEPPLKLEIGIMKDGSPAAKAHLAVGDKLIAIDKKPIKDWMQIATTVHAHPDQTLLFTIKRDGKRMEVPVITGSERNWLLQKSGIIGIGPKVDFPENLQQKVQYSLLGAIPKAVDEVINLLQFNVLIFGKLITGKMSLQSLGGPVTIFSGAGNSLNYGFLPFIGFLAFLSLSIGFINIFPIPGLDGGHLLIQALEAITRRKLSDSILNVLYRMGFIFILLIMIQAIVNDVQRLF